MNNGDYVLKRRFVKSTFILSSRKCRFIHTNTFSLCKSFENFPFVKVIPQVLHYATFLSLSYDIRKTTGFFISSIGILYNASLLPFE